MNCHEIDRFIYVYLDGELDGRDRADFEAHLGCCEACRTLAVREGSFLEGIRGAFKVQTPAPAALRARVRAALDREGEASLWQRIPLLFKLAPLPVAAAVAGLLVWPMVRGTPVATDVEEAVAAHQRHLPSEVRGNAGDVQAFLQEHVPFKVRIPFSDSASTKLVGARLAQARDLPAVVFFYDHQGKTVSVVQYAEKADDHQLAGADCDRSTGRCVLRTTSRGHNVVVFDDAGIRNSVVADPGMDDREIMQLIPASYAP